MARPTKNTVDFPKWKPSMKTLLKIYDSIDQKDAFKAFRQSSSGFIKKQAVRDSVLKKCDYKCIECGSDKNLQIDHIQSVYQCFKNGMIASCNELNNLQVLCVSCNTSKRP